MTCSLIQGNFRFVEQICHIYIYTYVQSQTDFGVFFFSIQNMSRWSNWMNWPWTNYCNQLLGESALKRSLKQEELRLLLWISFFIQLNAQQFNCFFNPNKNTTSKTQTGSTLFLLFIAKILNIFLSIW